MHSDDNRCIYRNNQLADVICQLRFPIILSIDAKPPADFQEIIRDEFPQYHPQKEIGAPKITGTPGNFNVENPPATTNYQFASADGVWRINLTNSFISLSCSQYTSWETFAKKLDKPLAAFIRIYKPAFFERVGLRYINTFSRSALSLEEVPFRDLFTSPYLGILSMEDIDEHNVPRCSIDAEFAIRGGCRAKVHAGPGRVKRNNHTDGEVKFIFDQDLYMSGNIPVNYSAGSIETLHSQSYTIFRNAITERLHNALEPID